MHVAWRLHCLTVVAFLCSKIHRTYASHSTISVKDGGYSGIVVTFDSNIKESHRAQVIQRTQELFINASEYLYEATQKRLFWREVIFQFPKDWQVSSTFSSIDPWGREVEDTDFLVTSQAFSYSDGIHTQQYAGCGKPGKRIYMTQKFIDDNGVPKSGGSKAKAIVREWARYRYGVFEEHGYTEDAQFPSYYSLPGSKAVKLATCAAAINASQVEVKITKRDKHGEDCALTTDSSSGLPELNGGKYCYPATVTESLTENADIVSSLMFRSDLRNVKHFCNKETHNSDGPTKQNVMCDGRSIWEIFELHNDFKENLKPSSSKAPITFTRTHPVDKDVVVIFDVQSDQGAEHEINRATDLTKLMKTFSYNANAAQIYTFKSVTDVVNTNGRVLTRSGNSPINLSNALQSDIVTQSHPHTGSSMIFVTSGRLLDSDTEMNEAVRLIKERRISFKVIIFPYSGSNSDLVKINEFVRRTNGEIHLQKENLYKKRMQIETRFDLYNALVKFSGRSSQQLLLNYELFKNQMDINYKFQIDQSLVEANSTLGAFIYADTSESFRYIANKAELSDGINKPFIMGLEAFKVEPSQLKAGTWTISVKTPSGQDTYLAGAVAFPSKPHESIQVRCWHSLSGFEMTLDENNVLIAYAFVARGEFGYVQNAKVNLFLYNVDGDSLQFDMYDDGFGDPDITKGDGIYSAYIVGVEHKRVYRSVVRVSSKEDTKEVRPSSTSRNLFTDLGGSHCCGSFIPEAEKHIELVQRQVDCGTFVVFNLSSTKSPVGTIKNLKISRINFDEKEVVFTFRAPYGNIQTVEFRYFRGSQKNDITPERFSSKSNKNWDYFVWDYKTLDGNPPELTYGKEVPVKFAFPFVEAGEYYFAVKITGGGQSRVSNPVKFYIEKGSFKEGGLPRWLAISFIVAGLLVLFLVCIVCLVCVVMKKRKKKRYDDQERAASERRENDTLRKSTLAKSHFPNEERSKTPSVFVVKENEPISPVQSWPADVLLNHYSDVQRAKARNEPPPIMTLDDLEELDEQQTPTASTNHAFVRENNVPYVTQFQQPSTTTSDTSSEYDPHYGVIKKPRAVTQV